MPSATLFDYTPETQTQQPDYVRSYAALQRSLLRALPDLVFLHSPDGIYLDYYTNSPEHLISRPEAFLGRSIKDVLPAEQVTTMLGGLKTAALTGSAELEYEIPLAGELRSFETRMQLTEDGNVLSLVRDVTKLKQARQTLQRQNHYLSSVQAAALELLDRLELDDFLETLLARAAELTGAAHGVVYVVDERGDLSPAAWLGAFEKVTLEVGDSVALASSPWQTGETAFFNDVKAMPELPGFACAGLARAVVIPLQSGAGVSGLICLAEMPDETQLSQTSLLPLKTFAQLASVALDNARLFDEAQRELHARTHQEKVLRESEARYRDLYDENIRLHEATKADLRRTEALHAVSQAITNSNDLDDLLAVIVESTHAAASAFWTAIYVIDEKKPGEPIAYASVAAEGPPPGRMNPHQFSNSLAGWSVRERQTAFSPGGERDERESLKIQNDRVAQGLGAVLCAPLFYKSSVLGTLMVIQREDDPDFSERDRDLLEAVANQVSLALVQRQLFEQVQHHAYHDVLTGLPNRLLFEDRLEQSIARARRSKLPFALLFVDLDGFKTVNDSLGHQAGDDLLCQVADRLQSRVRESDTLARMGGDEFALILNDLRDPKDAPEVAKQYLDLFQKPFYIAGNDTKMSASIGLCLYPEDGEDAESLLQRSDAAMYRVKRFGKNGVQRFSAALGEQVRDEAGLERDLNLALQAGAFELYYQPQISLRTLEPVGAEALLRWQHPEHGFISPSTFIPVAERSGLIAELGEWVLREACRQNAAWQRAGHLPVQVAVNVSSLQFMRPDFISKVALALEDSGLEPVWLELELTESLTMQDTGVVASRLEMLRDMGVRVAIDDFGTGYSSLRYLQQLHFDALKIDRAFIAALEEPGEDERAHAEVLVKTMVTMAKSLGLNVVAEGVETQEQLRFLKRIRCAEVQGYLFSKPLPAAKVWPRLAELAKLAALSSDPSESATDK